MAKWADYCISAVRYSYDDTHIDKVRVHADNGETIGAEVEHARTQVVSAIERGETFVTIYKSNGRWKKGEDVHIIVVNRVKYIRTDTNHKAADNLGNLPRF